MVEKSSTFDRTLAMFAQCSNCDALVLSYASSHFPALMPGNEERWSLTCDRCGTVFYVSGDEVLLPSIPASWLFSKPNLAN